MVVDRKDTSASYATEDVGSSTLEQGPYAFLGDDLAPGIQRRLVLDGLELRLLTTSLSFAQKMDLPRRKSSSYADGWYQEDKKQYQRR